MYQTNQKNEKSGFTPPLSSKRAGFTIIEVLFAALIITVGVIGAVNFVPKIISNTQANSSRFIASYLAQEGFEIVRNIRDGNWLEGDLWSEGLNGCSAGCTTDYTVLGQEDAALNTARPANQKLKLDENLGYNYDIGSETKFARKISIDDSENNKLEVKITITYDSKSYEFNTVLYAWK